MDKSVESFIDTCDEMMIAEEGFFGGIVTGVIFAPFILFATIGAIMSICSAVSTTKRNISEKVKGTQVTAKMYREVKMGNMDKFDEGMAAINKFVNDNPAFIIPKDIYDKIIEFKKDSAGILSNLLSYMDIIKKQKSTLGQYDKYCFGKEDLARDTKLIENLKKLESAINVVSKKLVSQKLNIDSPKYTDKGEKISITSAQLKDLLSIDQKYLEAFKFLSDIDDCTYQGNDDEYLYFSKEDELLVYYTRDQLDDGDDIYEPLRAPIVAYSIYSGRVNDLTEQILRPLSNYIQYTIKAISHVKIDKEKK